MKELRHRQVTKFAQGYLEQGCPTPEPTLLTLTFHHPIVWAVVTHIRRLTILWIGELGDSSLKTSACCGVKVAESHLKLQGLQQASVPSGETEAIGMTCSRSHNHSCGRAGLESGPPNFWPEARMTHVSTLLNSQNWPVVPSTQKYVEGSRCAPPEGGEAQEKELVTAAHRRDTGDGGGEGKESERAHLCFTLTFWECRPWIPGLLLGTQRERRCWWASPPRAGKFIWTNGKGIRATKRAELQKGFLFVLTKQSNLSLDPFMAE